MKQTISIFLSLLCVAASQGQMLMPIVAGSKAFSPADLPSLTLWLDPSKGTYTDTGLTTPATTDGANVKGWADQSAAANNATGAVQCILKLAANGINGFPALSCATGNGRLTTPSFLGSGYNTAFTVYQVMLPTDNASIKLASSFQGTTTYIASETDTAFPPGAKWTFNANIPVTSQIFAVQGNTTDQSAYVLSFQADGTQQLFRLNNILKYYTLGATVSLTGAWTVGGNSSSTSFTYAGLLGDILVYNAGHTRAQQLQVTNYLMTKYGIPNVSSSVSNSALQGNSLTLGGQGTGGKNGSNDVGTDIALALGKTYSFFAHGISGRTIDAMITDAPTEDDPSLMSGVRNIYLAWEGTNQLVSSTGAQCVTKYKTLMSNRTAAGWNKRIVVDTLPSCSYTAPQEAQRLLLNASLATDFNVATAYAGVYSAGTGVTWADYLVKLTDNATVGQVGQCSNTTYYTDGTHMTPAGYALVAPYMSNAIILASQ